jgi:hypothetical protein
MKTLVIAIAIIAVFASSAFAQFAPEVLRVRGDAKIMKQGSSEWIIVTEKMNVHDGDTIRTGKDGVVAVGFVENRKNLLRVGKDSEVFITDGMAPDFSVKLVRGDAIALVLSLPQNSVFEIATIAGVSRAHGTGWRAKIDGDIATFEAFDNSITAHGLYADGSLMLESTFVNMGYMTTVKKFSAPVTPVRIPPADMDLWNTWRDEVKDIMAKANMVNN